MNKLEEGKISSDQLLLLLVTTVLPTAVLFLPAVSVKAAGRDAWLSILVVTSVFGLAVIFVATALGMRFPGKTIMEYSEDIIGRWPGKILGFAYIFFFIYTNAIVIREFGDFLVAAFMPETPLSVFIMALLFIAASSVRNGLEVIARMNQFVVPLMMFMLVIIFTLVFGEADFKKLLPVMAEGIKPMLHGALTPMAWRGEVVLITMFMPYLNIYKKARMAGNKAVLLLTAILTVDIVMSLAVFGVASEFHTFPTYFLAFYIGVAGFVERIEAFILALWVAGVTVKVAIWYYAAVLATAQWLHLKDYRPVVLPVGVILAAWSVTIYDNTRELVDFIVKTFPFYAYTFELFIPAALLLIALMRKKGQVKNK